MTDKQERTISSLGDDNIVAEMLAESDVVDASAASASVAHTASPFMQNRELSWLTFNQRVLDQGADETVPLLERLNFVSIFWSNLQEFFMVRVGSLTDLALVKKRIIDTKSKMTPDEQLDAIYARCHELYPIQEAIYTDLRAKLADEGIEHLHAADLDEKQRIHLHDHIAQNVMPFLSPQIVNSRHPFPHLENGAIYVVVRLDDEAADAPADEEKRDKPAADDKASDKATAKTVAKPSKKGKRNLAAEGVTLGIIPMPRQCERVIKLPGEGLQYILIEEALEMVVPDIFSMYTVKHTNVICVTRNADLDSTEGTDENDEDYREHMRRILKKRSRLAPVRLESVKKLSKTVSDFLLKRLKLKPHQVFVTSVPLDMSYTYSLAGKLDQKRRAALTFPPFTPQWPADLSRTRPIIEQVSEAETLLTFPYETMDPFVQLLKEASVDPSVISIKITLYRLASQSHLAEALIAAAEMGKEVTALFELRARFDESNNIEWSQRFEQAGAKVIYGFRDFKVHSKICCITRQTDSGIQHITQLGTGNYNEKTAKLYTDLSFITTDPAIGRDATEFFRNMGLENASNNYDVLWVAPLQIKPMILAGIDRQIERARAGEPSGLFFKTNSVTDKDIIVKLSEASEAGVPVLLFVRGISCIVPGIEGFTENVRVVSIVGRLLEHSRIYGFGPRDSMDIYLSSADLMTRNMEKRVEIAWPVLSGELRDEIAGYIDVSMRDTAKLRELLPDKSYTPLGYFAETDANGEKELFDSQEYFICEAEERRLAAAMEAAERDANRGKDEGGAPIAEKANSHVADASEAAGGAPEREAAGGAVDAAATRTREQTADPAIPVIEPERASEAAAAGEPDKPGEPSVVAPTGITIVEPRHRRRRGLLRLLFGKKQR
ncbi:polyphosphate kinase 1 [Raoultibacter phocaeensis]|uniref:polyphosphate kinase 1 n=1 Tax=Raoultibacter phocaeensis TaxID=2479841 RepID=UPI002105F893|nr:polyphosphate kinase 1 [Raoultibacter phocaeensis]